MKISFRDVFVTVFAGIIMYAALTWHYQNKVSSISSELRKEKERNSEIIVNYNTEIGEYTTKLGELTDNLSSEKTLTKEQRKTIEILERELQAKVTEISNLSIKVDSLSSQGQATIVVTAPDTMLYTIDEKKQGIRLKLDLWHPQGAYVYSITQDPLIMELIVAKDKQDGLKIGSVRFPNNPNVSVNSWELFYDTDLRPWYTVIWDDININTGIFAGADSGVFGTLGYKQVNVGPVFTEKGTSIMFSYKIK